MKKNSFKQCAALLSALILLVCSVVSCSETPADAPAVTTAAPAATDAVTGVQTENPYDENGYLKDSLPADLKFNGQTVTELYASDFAMTEFFSTETTGDFINDAVFNRNIKVEERLGVKLEFVGTKGGDDNQDNYMAKAQADASSGDSAYDVYAGYSRTIPLLANGGMLTNLMELPYPDIDKPWWPDAVRNELTIKNKLYFCTGDISTNLLWMMSALFFNQQMWTDNTFGFTPYELVENNEWTLEKFYEIMGNFYKDDGNGVRDDNDVFGLCAYNACLDAFQNSAGIISIDKDEDGNLKLSDDYLGERMINLVAQCGQIFTSDSTHHSSTSSTEQNLFISGHSLFMIDALYIVRGKDNGGTRKIEFEYGLVPGPKFDKDQAAYVTNLRYPFNMYGLNVVSKNNEPAAAVLECLASEGYRGVTPLIFEGAMKTRYSADSTTSKMYDILRETVCFDMGRVYGYCLGNYYPDFRKQALAGGGGWASLTKSLKKQTQKYLDVINQAYD